jgi:two-component system cell cycle response regulator CtrA
MRALLVEDDLVAARGISLILTSSGAVVDHAVTGEEALELTGHSEFDVVLVDLTLPGIGGYEVVRRMRDANNDTPVLILSGMNLPRDKVKGLAIGADDYVTKPFDKGELLARVRAVIRRTRSSSPHMLRAGPLTLTPSNRVVTVHDHELRLTGKEYAILELLMQRMSGVLTKDTFLSHLYGGVDEPEGKIIDVFICKLRRKLAQAGAGDLIKTVWGQGYTIRASGDDRASVGCLPIVTDLSEVAHPA